MFSGVMEQNNKQTATISDMEQTISGLKQTISDLQETIQSAATTTEHGFTQQLKTTIK